MKPVLPSQPNGFKLALGIALAQFVLHVATNGNYGIFRDELYYLDCARHLGWGYVDHPPLSIWLLAATKAIFGESVHSIRLLSQLAGAIVVVIAALIARELGGGKTAQVFAALLTAGAPGFLILSGLFSMNAFDLVIWAALAWILARLVRTDDPALWLWFGAVAGVGLLNKISVPFLAVGLAVALVLSPLRRHLGRWQLYAGVGIAALFLLPYVLWNLGHDWATLEFMANAKRYKIVAMSPLEFLAEQVLANGPLLAPLWLGGLVWLLVPRWGGRYRVLGITFIGVFATLVVLKVKPYYLFPAFTMLFAAAGCAIEDLLGRLRTPVARKVAGGLTVGWILFSVMISLPLALPVLSPEKFLDYQVALGIKPRHAENNAVGEMPQYFSDRFGWKNMAEVVAEVYAALPAEEREGAIIAASNYGEAGAINHFGPELGLPRAYSTHNNHFFWGPPPADLTVVIHIGSSAEDFMDVFESVRQVATVNTVYGMPYENDLPIFVLRRPKAPIAEIWAAGRKFI